MAISIQISDAAFTHTIASLSLPNRSGLVGEYIFGGSAAASIVNRAAPGLAAMSVVGAPTYGANYAKIKSGGGYGSIGFDTGMTTPVNATIIAVVRKDTACPVFIAAETGGYEGFLNFTSAPLLYNAQFGTTANVANVAVPAHSDFAFFAGRMPRGGFGEIHTFTGGVLTTDVAETAGSATSRASGTLKVGTTLTNSGVGIADIAYAAIFERVLTAAEISATYASLKAFLATRGVAVS